MRFEPTVSACLSVQPRAIMSQATIPASNQALQSSSEGGEGHGERYRSPHFVERVSGKQKRLSRPERRALNIGCIDVPNSDGHAAVDIEFRAQRRADGQRAARRALRRNGRQLPRVTAKVVRLTDWKNTVALPRRGTPDTGNNISRSHHRFDGQSR